MLCALAAPAFFFAQTEPEPIQPETVFDYEPIRSGDQYIHVSLGPNFPLFSVSADGVSRMDKLNLGGLGNLAYSRFISSRMSLGGEISFAYNSTLGKNTFFYLPLTFKASYELVYNRIHVPLSLAGGFAFQTYLNRNYFGLVLKPEAAAYFQYNPEWSFGGSVGWHLLPQFYEESSYNRLGNFASVTLGFRYHF